MEEPKEKIEIDLDGYTVDYNALLDVTEAIVQQEVKRLKSLGIDPSVSFITIETTNEEGEEIYKQTKQFCIVGGLVQCVSKKISWGIAIQHDKEIEDFRAKYPSLKKSPLK